MRNADFKVQFKNEEPRWVKDVPVVGSNPKLIVEHPRFRKKVYVAYFGENNKKKAVQEFDKNSLKFLRVKLGYVTGYTQPNANWGTGT